MALLPPPPSTCHPAPPPLLLAILTPPLLLAIRPPGLAWPACRLLEADLTVQYSEDRLAVGATMADLQLDDLLLGAATTTTTSLSSGGAGGEGVPGPHNWSHLVTHLHLLTPGHTWSHTCISSHLVTH